MAFTGSVEEATPFALRGWVASDTFPTLIPFVDIVVNRRTIATVRSGVIKDERRWFHFNPFESLSTGMNVVEVFVAGSDQLLDNGTHRLSGELTTSPPQHQATTPADVSAFDSFLDEVEQLVPIELDSKILATGTGLAKAVLGRGFACEQGLPTATATFDIVLSARECEHWFPSIAPMLNRIYDSLKPGGMTFLDFPVEDPELAIARAFFDGAAFNRIYSETELRTFFLEAGFEVLDLNVNQRALLAARKPKEIR